MHLLVRLSLSLSSALTNLAVALLQRVGFVLLNIGLLQSSYTLNIANQLNVHSS